MSRRTDLDAVLAQIHREIRPVLGQGRVADYIPRLAEMASDRFGMAVETLDGECSAIGDAAEPFSIQSICKIFALTLAMQRTGEALWQRVGREPSGNPFNSLVQLEYEQAIPRNPLINAGALVVTDMLLSEFGDTQAVLRDFVRKLADDDSIDYDREVAQSERAWGHRNAALAHFIKSFGNLQNDVDRVLDAYCLHCSLAMNCRQLARAMLFLANHGALPWSSERLISTSEAKRINSLLLTCGTYDAVGDFAYRVGLPGKSGVGGGIVAVVPRAMGLCVWSPGLNENGNSLAGTLALELFTTKTDESIF